MIRPIGLIRPIRPIRPIRLILLAALVLLAAFELAIRQAWLPQDRPSFTPIVTDRRGEPIAVLPTPTARAAYPRPLRAMGRWLPLATVAIEDHRFATHHGVDWHALGGATLRNLRNLRVISGASTITQQLVKISSPPAHRTLAVKAREALTALKLERHLTKDQILENYLNRIDYGNRRIGAEAAAQAYFGKSARDLTLAEAIFLAGLPQSPARLNPWRNPQGALTRYQRNVRRMADNHLLPDGITAAALLATPPKPGRHDPPNEAPRFVDLVPGKPTPVLVSSLDLSLQKSVDALLHAHLASLLSADVHDAAVVVIDNPTGEVRALACAGVPQHAAINSATEPRSCGSTLKPFLYLDAIAQRKLTAASLLPDTPDAITAEYADYDPQNYSGRSRGPVRLREALANSLNVPAVVTLGELGARSVHEFLRGWGLHFPESFDTSGAGFILGNARVTLLDLAGAYATLARGGIACAPRVTPHEPRETRRVASPESCAIITDILCDNAARQISFGRHSPLEVGPRTAVKTGTSSGFRDGWCVGFNGRHTVAVWAGNLDGRPMPELLAVRSAAPLWAAVMKHLEALGDPPVPPPTESPALRHLAVASETGFLPRPDEPTVPEWFLAGTEPKENAASLYKSGILQLPPAYAAWCASPQNHLGARVRSGKLAILFPKNGSTFLLEESLPASQQALSLECSRTDCAWFLNGTRLETPVVPLRRGTWTLTARADGEAVESRFVVE